MSIKCFYHAGDLDGWCSGAIVKHFNQLALVNTEMIPINYGDKFPYNTISSGDVVYMVDFSLPMGEMARIEELVGGAFVWIDHHIGAIRDYDKTQMSILGLRNTDVAACELTWEYFCDEETPFFIKLLSAYDVWDHSGTLMDWDNIEAFQYGFKAGAYNPKDNMDFWDNWINRPSDITSPIKDKILDGFKIQSYVEDRFQANLTDRSYIIDWEGYRCLVINSDPYIANYMTRCMEYNGGETSQGRVAPCDIAINYCSNKGRSWIVNLRTTRDDIDLSVLAKKYGGGGHKSAAGYPCKELNF